MTRAQIIAHLKRLKKAIALVTQADNLVHAYVPHAEVEQHMRRFRQYNEELRDTYFQRYADLVELLENET